MEKNLLFIVLYIIIPFTLFSQNSLVELEEKLEFAVEISGEFPDSAINIFTEIESKVLETKESDLAANMYRRKANCYFFKLEHETALSYYDKALGIRKSSNLSQTDSTNLSEIANLYYNKALVNQQIGNYPAAFDNLNKIEDIYINIKNYIFLAFKCYNYTAKLYYFLGDYENAMEYSAKEVELNERIKDSINLSHSLDFQAVIKQAQELNEDALELQLESLNIRETLGDSLLISYSYNNIGSTYLLENDYVESLSYFEKSLGIKIRNGLFGVVASYNNIGLVFQKQEMYEESLRYYQKSYDYCTEVYVEDGIETASINLGVTYDLLGFSKEAEKYFVKAVDIGLESGKKKTVVVATDHAQAYYSKQGRFKEAYEMLLLNQIYKDSIKNDDVIKEISRLKVEHEYRQIQVADSIMYQQAKIHNDQSHSEAMKRKEQMIWILAITFIFIIFIIFALFKAYQLRKRSDENVLKQQTLEIEKNLLRSQMNPHFIFNAMNSIQSFIAENDSYSALRYLSKFAKLIRLILENSMHQTIPLQDEMQSLELYMELEKVRFNNKFDFKFNIEDNISEDNIQVPPMLIQPFIENAIIHGIMPLEKTGLIEINLSTIEKHDVIRCEVIDNGIGRDASAKLKKSQGKKHKSIGMQVSRQRLESLNKQTQKLMSYEVSDVMSDGKVSGTKVSLLIPFTSEF